MYAVTFSSNSDLKKEEYNSNKKLAEKIGGIINAKVIPVSNYKKDLNQKYTKIFNLCDNNENTGSGFFETAVYLEKINQAHTGASSKVLYFFVDKERWIKKIYKHSILPKNSFLNNLNLTPPLILKYAHQHGSENITLKNILCKLPAAIPPGTYLEEFIDGDEFSYCEVPGLFTASIKKEVCHNKICDYNFKWKKQTQEKVELVNHTRMRKYAKLIKNTFSLKSYYRIDYRIKNNKIYIFDINPNCYLGEDGTLAKAAKLLGINYNRVIDKIFY